MNMLVKKCIADRMIVGGYSSDYYFTRIYPFTTENINGYLSLLDLNNKSLLTVGSSADQVLNAVLCGVNNIDVYDLCPFCEEYYNLKKAAIQVLSREEFLDFFCYKNYPKNFINNDNAFNLSSYFKIREVLKEINYDIFCFWDYLFSEYGGLKIRESLFSTDEDSYNVIIKMNKYLTNDLEYLKLRSMISDVNVNFKIGNIFDMELDKSYDNINLSNIASYNDVELMGDLFNKLLSYLNYNGRILIAYLYHPIIETDDWTMIYDIDNTLKFFPSNVEFSSFIGPRGILHNCENIKDSVIVYKKIKKM